MIQDANNMRIDIKMIKVMITLKQKFALLLIVTLSIILLQ